MLDRKISTAALAAVVCAAGAAIAAPAASAAPCGITAVAIADESPIKFDATNPNAEIAKRRGDTKNVGQEVALRARTTGAPTGTVSFLWSVGGDVIDDYTETPAETTPEGRPETEAVANPFAVQEHANVVGGRAVFTSRNILFYWRMGGIPLPRDVNVMVGASEQHEGDAQPHICAANSKFVTVERNQNDPDSQPEDFYVDINHDGQVLREHLKWHVAHVCCGGYDGRLFPVFHSRFLANYDAFRATFGHPDKGQYRPPNNLPTQDANGYTLEHTPYNRGRRVTEPVAVHGNVSGYRRPHWATLGGGTAQQGHLDGSDCQLVDPPDPPRLRLGDFPTLAELGCALETPWHNRVHGMIGGDLNNAGLAPKDPIFWRWHGYLNGVFQEYENATVTSASVEPPWPAAFAAQRRRARTCNGLVPTIRGTSRADRLRGTRRADVISGGSGRDRITGLAGNDIICGGPGNDRLTGGAGFDAIRGGGGADRILGGRDGDAIEGGPRRDRLAGGAGTDGLFGGGGRDALVGGAGNEWMLHGGPGSDRIDGSGGVDMLHGGNGDDRLVGGAGPDSLDGGEGDDAINGGAGEDSVLYVDAEGGVRVDLGDGTATGDGRDRLEGIDRIEGSSEADTIVGGSGDETINGGEGNDDISGGGGEDALHGGTGNDDVAGGGGDDHCAAGEDTSSCQG